MIDGYVYKQTAIDAIAKVMPSLTTPDGSGEFDHDIHIADEAFVDSMQIIHDLPSADVQPVRHGYWIKDGHHITCDQCGQSMCDKDREGNTIPQNFCPNCGVRMDGEQE